jgi:hypothetical protein
MIGEAIRAALIGSTEVDRQSDFHSFNANQIAIATMAKTLVPQTAGVTRFVLPLRGESFAAWLNSLFMSRAANRETH